MKKNLYIDQEELEYTIYIGNKYTLLPYPEDGLTKEEERNASFRYNRLTRLYGEIIFNKLKSGGIEEEIWDLAHNVVDDLWIGDKIDKNEISVIADTLPQLLRYIRDLDTQ